MQNKGVKIIAYPKKLRERALEALRKGYKREEVRKMYGLGAHTLYDWEKLEAETGSLEKRPLIRNGLKINREELLQYYRENPLSTNKEAAAFFNCSVSGIRSAKKVLKITRKKRQSSI